MGNLVIGLFYLFTVIMNIPAEDNIGKHTVKAASIDTEWISVEATAYTAKCKGCSGITKTGYNVLDQSIDYRIIAVDPSIIPLYSIVEIEGMGIYRALDIGGDIKNHRIDILMQSKEKARTFGRQQVRVRIIKRGDNSERNI